MSATTDRPDDRLAQRPKIGTRLDVTGTWRPIGRRRHRSPGAAAARTAWDAVRAHADSNDGISIEVAEIIGGGGRLVHLTATDHAELAGFLDGATDELRAIRRIERPDRHMVRGLDVGDAVRGALDAAEIPTTIGRWSYGFVTDAADEIDPGTAIEVTAVWRCTGDDLAGLERAWRQVATDALELEPGLVRFEAHAIDGEHALVIHETFASSDDLKFHLTKGTAAMHKKDIDRIAAPDAYLFRGPVAWSIRTYSKLMRLPASYAAAG